MSVINRMLQDLQARQSGLAVSPALVMATPPASPAGSRRLGGLLLGGGALIAVAAYGPWPVAGDASASHGPAPVAMGQAAPTVMQASAAAVPVATKALARQATHPALLAKAAPLHATPQTRPVPHALATSAPASASAPSAAPTTTAAPAASGSVDKRMQAETPRQRAQSLYKQAADLASTGHVRQAADLALESLKADPTYSDVRQFAVSLLYEQQRLAEAESLARDGLALSKQQAQLAYLLARMMTDRGSSKEALELLDQQTTLSAEGHGLRAGILSQMGHFKRASQDYQSAVMQQPDNSLWWLGLGVALEALGQSQEARRVYAKAQSLGLDRPDLSAFVDQKLRTMN